MKTVSSFRPGFTQSSAGYIKESIGQDSVFNKTLTSIHSNQDAKIKTFSKRTSDVITNNIKGAKKLLMNKYNPFATTTNAFSPQAD